MSLYLLYNTQARILSIGGLNLSPFELLFCQGTRWISPAMWLWCGQTRFKIPHQEGFEPGTRHKVTVMLTAWPLLPSYSFKNYVMLYGSGQFPSGAEGEGYVPLKYIKKCCGNHFKSHEVNEFWTSQICPDCEKCRLDEVIKSSPGMMTQSKIRGLKWCTSKECKHNPFKNRDMVGSINIMKKGLNVENPNSLFSKEKVPWSHRTPNAHMMYYPSKVMAKRE